MIILIGGEKGGTGKTTLSTNLAAIMMKNNSDVLLVDTDKQGSASAWCAMRDEIPNFKRIPCIQKFGPAIASEIKDLSNRYEDIIIDAGGRDSVELRATLTVADKVFIPIQASQFDVWTLGAMDNLVNLATPYNPTLKAFVVINRASTNPSVSESRETKEIFDDFQNLRLLQSMIRDRIAYRKAARSGLSVVELEQPDSKANSEIEDFYREVIIGNEKNAA